ncbi:hypothetical protein BSKO_12318 [Bryopsis sp. KO-2023]|nr:hypothetical protein BSKO_12318 [Bryopsis sp. KO-2023]
MKPSLASTALFLANSFFLCLVGCSTADQQGDHSQIHVTSCIDLYNAFDEIPNKPNKATIVVDGFLNCANFQWGEQLTIKGEYLLVGGVGEREEMPVGIDFGGTRNAVNVSSGAELSINNLKIFQGRMEPSPLEISFFSCALGSKVILSEVLNWSKNCSLGVNSYHVELGTQQLYLEDLDLRPRRTQKTRSRWKIVDSDLETNHGVGVETHVAVQVSNAVACCGVCEEAQDVISQLGGLIAPETAYLFANDPLSEDDGSGGGDSDFDRAFPWIRIVSVVMGSLALLLLGGWSFILCLPRSKKAPGHNRKDTGQLGVPQKREPAVDCAVVRTRRHHHHRLSLEDIEIGSPIGQGGFGKVYKGHHGGETVAIKVFEHDANLISDGGEPMEVHVARSINHPNVVKTLLNQTRDRASVHSSLSMSNAFPLFSIEMDSHRTKRPRAGSAQLKRKDTDDFSYMACHLGSDSERCFRTWIVMEYCDKGSLASGIRSSHFHDMLTKQPKLDLQLLSMFDIANAMSHLHSQRIIHGDLKSQNVLLKSSKGDQRGFCCKVCDFGFSRGISNEAYIETFTCGTVSHMPPELLKEGKLTPSADVYSFAILMWELFTGVKPYRNMRHSEIVITVTEGKRQAIPENCPAPLASLINDCWQDDYSRRPSFRTITERLRDMLYQTVDLFGAGADPLARLDKGPRGGVDSEEGVPLGSHSWKFLPTQHSSISDSDGSESWTTIVDNMWPTQKELTDSIGDIQYNRLTWEASGGCVDECPKSTGTSLTFNLEAKPKLTSRENLWDDATTSTSSRRTFRPSWKRADQDNKITYTNLGRIRSSSCCEVLKKDRSISSRLLSSFGKGNPVVFSCNIDE